MRRALICLLCAAPLSCGYAEPTRPDASAETPKNVGATSYEASAGYAATAGYTADAGYAATSGSSSPEACGGDMSGTAGSCVVAKISGASPIDIVAMGSIQTAGIEIGSVTGDFGGCTTGCLGLKTATNVPTSAPTTGGLLYNNNVDGLSSYGVGGFQVLGLAPTGSGTPNANFHEQRQAWRGAISGSTTANTITYGMGATSLAVSVLRIHVVTVDTASFAGGYGEFVAGFACPAGGTPTQQGSTTIVSGSGTGGNAPTFAFAGACTITIKLSTTTDAVNATIEVEGLDGT